MGWMGSVCAKTQGPFDPFDNPLIPKSFPSMAPQGNAPPRSENFGPKSFTKSVSRSVSQSSTNPGLSIVISFFRPILGCLFKFDPRSHRCHTAPARDALQKLSVLSLFWNLAPLFSGTQVALYRVLPHQNTSVTSLFRCTEPTSTAMMSLQRANFQWTLPPDKMLRSCTYQV